MTSFEEALSAPSLHFKRLRQAEPVLVNGKIRIRRTYSAIESEIVWEGQRYLISLPFRREDLRHIEAFENGLHSRTRGPLIGYHILYEEVTLFDALGRPQDFDVVLQEIPCGMMLEDAIHRYKSADIKAAVEAMKNRLDTIGFRHNNLTPANIVICKSGVARPLRYWYAEWECFSDNNISQLLDLIERNSDPDLEDKKLPLVITAERNKTVRVATHEGISIHRKGGRYGYIDEDGQQITHYIYSKAGRFREGRAIVQRNKKMGAIDCNGHKIVPVIYNSLEFDIETSFFTATKDKYTYLIDYEGAIIRRTLINTEEERANIEA